MMTDNGRLLRGALLSMRQVGHWRTARGRTIHGQLSDQHQQRRGQPKVPFYHSCWGAKPFFMGGHSPVNVVCLHDLSYLQKRLQRNNKELEYT